MFMDNELGLDEKIVFINRINKEKGFYNESLELLEQEKVIRSDPVTVIPQMRFKKAKRWLPDMSLFRPFGLGTLAGAFAAIILLFSIFSFEKESVPSISHRFIIYEPGVSKVEISGSFTGWDVLPLKRIGSSGYWQINLDIPQGEHRYTYILEEGERIADPTILTREQDDFGGSNSILFVEI
jgi:hypothetical protein